MEHLPVGQWQPIADPVDRGEGIYAVRILRRRNQPWRMRRLLADDMDGILTLGRSDDIERRRKNFVSGVRTCYGHSAGNLLHLIVEHAGAFGDDLEDVLRRVEWTFEHVRTEATSHQREELMIKHYIRRFGEPPPLNCAIPKRYGKWPSSDG